MPAYKFSPNLASPEERRETFTAREEILQDLLDRVKKAESGARHCILIGPRGIGKTHLLLLLADTIEADKSLSSRWVVVRFAEEEYGIVSLAELFLKIIESLPGDKPKNIGRDVDLLLGHILDFRAASGKRILLLMDNIQLYFNQFPDADIGRMRDILMSRDIFLVIGAAPSYFRQMAGYDEAFYNFFEPVHLKELTSDEVEEMLRRRAQFEEASEFLKAFDLCRPKIKTTAFLTGGNPRLILMLYQVMCEAGVLEASEAFKQLLDELTPYFQARMESLPPQERKVLDTLAFMEEPSTPTVLAEAASMPVNAVTSQLKRLKDRGLVQQVKLRRSRETRYEVTERLFRMWREMRSETGRERIGFIVQFLKLWYTPVQLLDEAGRLLSLLGALQGHGRSALMTHLQYLKLASPEMLQPGMERAYAYAEAGRSELAMAGIEPLKELAVYEEDVKAKPDDAEAWYNRGWALGILGRYDEALESYDRAIQIKPDYAKAWVNRGVALGILGRYDEALESYDRAIQIEPNFAEARYNRGVELGNLSRYDEALESHDRAIQIKPDFAEAWNNRGVALGNLSRYDEALESCDRAIQIKPDFAEAWNNRGVALGNLGRYDEELESYDRAIQIKPNFAEAWYNRGVELGNLGRYDEALESFDRAIQIKPDDAEAWNNRGVALGNLDRYDEELESYDRAIQIKPDYAEAWYNRSVVLGRLDRYDEALESFDRAIQIKPDYAEAWGNRGVALGRLDRSDEALESFDRAIQIKPDYAEAWYNRSVVLGRSGRINEALESLRKGTELARAQNLEGIPDFAILLALETDLADSLQSLREDNLGSARSKLKDAIDAGKQADKEDFQLLLFGYFREAIRSGKTQFAQEAVGTVIRELGEEYNGLLRPLNAALEYMQTGDVGILERLQQEERELVLEISNLRQ